MLHWDVSKEDDPAQALACAVLLGLTIIAAVLMLVSGGGHAGIDFSCFWGAGTLALEGHAATAYDWQQLQQLLALRLQQINHTPYPYDEVPVPFFYPPVFFLVLAPLALLPFPIAFGVWSTAKLLCWLLVVHAIRPRSAALLLALAAPPVFYDFIAGQSSLLAASLLGGVLLTSDRRPILSGVLLGLLIFKPQYGVLLPFVLIATKRWRLFITASLVVPALLLISGIVFGWDTFEGFRTAATFATTQFHLSGALPWAKLQSVYGLFRLAGLGYGLAMSLHVAIALAASIWVLLTWRRNASLAVRAASLLAATPLISPYFAIYDMPILAIALVFLMNATTEDQISARSKQRGFRTGVSVIFVLGYAFPFVFVPVGPFMCATVIALILTRYRRLEADEIAAGKPLRRSATMRGPQTRA
ncbi:glycosyltransferase family 87 protein [Bradyrhizobium sp. USDA 4454]